jgi:carbon-monoxide dehydrogenase medium subunit
VPPNSSNAYAKVERRVGDWAVTAAGAAVTLDGDTLAAARVGLTAVNADADGLAGVTDVLVGRPVTEEAFAEAGRRAAAACRPVSDMRGSADYKRHLADELTKRTLRTAVARARGESARA